MDGFSIGLILAGALAAVQLVLLALQAFEHHRYAARRLQKKAYGQPTGQALVIIPCRGLEHNLEENLAGFFVKITPPIPSDSSCNHKTTRPSA